MRTENRGMASENARLTLLVSSLEARIRAFEIGAALLAPRR